MNIQSRILLSLFVLVYAFVFNLGYETVESIVHEYTGLYYAPPPLPYLIGCYLLCTMPCAWIPLKIVFPSQVIYYWLYLTIVVPVMFVPFHVLDLPASEIIWFPVSILVAFFLLRFVYLLPLLKLPKTNLTERSFESVLIFLAVFCGLFLAFTNGFNFNLAFEDVYERRLDARDGIAGGSLVGYLSAIFARCIGPIAIGYGLGTGRVLMLSLGIGVSFASFVLAGEKTLLFLPLFLLCIGIGITLFRDYLLHAMLVGATVLFLGAMAEYYLFDSTTLSAYGTRRVFVVPAHLSAYYWEYFGHDGFAYFARGIVGRITGASGEMLSPAQSIGAAYFGTADANANANVWASGYAELGVVGIFIMTLVMGVTMRLLDSLISPRFFVTGCLIAGCFALAWAEGAYQTSLLSSGVAPTLAILYLMNARPQKTFKLEKHPHEMLATSRVATSTVS